MRRVLLAIIFPIALAHAWAVAFTGCNALTPAESASVAVDATQLATCAAGAHLCKQMQRTNDPDASLSPCWAEYDECMSGHGFADASVDAKGDR